MSLVCNNQLQFESALQHKRCRVLKNLTDVEMALISEVLVAKMQKQQGLSTEFHSSGNAPIRITLRHPTKSRENS